jgi:hypothetical protein
MIMASGKTTELDLPYPIKEDPDTIASDIGELAKKVDELLRKQLTKLVEVAKLKVTTSIELPAKAIVAAAMAEHSITEANKALASESIVTGNIKAEAVTAAKIAAAAVPASKLGLGTVRQEGEPAQSFLSWGEISGTGAILSGSGDFTAEKIETGAYQIIWTKGKSSANYAVIITCGNKNCVATVETTTASRFVMRQFSENLAVGVGFSFVALSAS